MNLSELEQRIKARFLSAVLFSQLFRGELSIEVASCDLKTILLSLKESEGFDVLMDLTSVDYIFPETKTKVLYWLHNPKTFERVRIYTFVKRNESLPSVVDLFAGAAWYEREIYDLFGVIFKNHPNLTRLLMPDDWEGHPLRKDYALTEEKVAFKQGAKPKTPSEIIDLKESQKNLAS